jgi:hypothetical protein
MVVVMGRGVTTPVPQTLGNINKLIARTTKHDFVRHSLIRGVTKRCRLSWLTNSVLVYEPKCGGREELWGLSQ